MVADAGLGTINHVVTTCEYIKNRHIPIKGIILNNWQGGVMEEDNVKMIEEITGVKVIALVKKEIPSSTATPRCWKDATRKCE